MESMAEFEMRMERNRRERMKWIDELERPKWEAFLRFVAAEKARKAKLNVPQADFVTASV